MWTRASLKERAKGALRGRYWKAFIVSLVIVFAGGSFINSAGSSSGRNHSSNSRNNSVYTSIGNAANNVNSYANRINNRIRNSNPIDIIETYVYRLENNLGSIMNRVVHSAASMVIGFVVLGAIVVRTMLRLLVGYHLEVGGRRYFIQAAQGESRISHITCCLKSEYYGNVMGAMFLRSLYIFLWRLLFVIPGVVKSYAYRMVPFILADNPGIGHKRAIELSNRMTRGHKLEMFILDLSFLGWYFVGALLAGIGIFFVNPYVDSTFAELYLTLRQNAVDSGMTDAVELGLRLQ